MATTATQTKTTITDMRIKLKQWARLRLYLCCAADDGLMSETETLTRKLNLTEEPSVGRSRRASSKRENSEHTSPLPDAVIEMTLRILLKRGDMLSVRRAMLVCKQWARVAQSILTRKPRMPELPDEILIKIFSAVRFSRSQDPAADLASSLRTCKQWYRVGMPLLYQNFVMDVNYRTASNAGPAYAPQEMLPRDFNSRYTFVPSARFYDTATKLWSQPWTDTGIGVWIHSLSVEIHFEDTYKPKYQQSIADVIKELPNIRTFSVRAAPLKGNNYIGKARLTDLIANMPSKIVNFELDLQSRDTSYDSTNREQGYSCKALGKLLPQLSTLRLRLAVMCREFLGEISKPGDDRRRTCPNLKALSISLYSQDFMAMARCCTPVNWSQLVPLHQNLVFELEARIQDGTTFPNLKACSIISLHDDMSAQMAFPRRIICKNFQADTRTWTKRAFFPCAVAFGEPWYIRTDADGDDAETVMPSFGNWDYWSFPGKLRHGKETDALFEGDAWWTEDPFGARFPPKV
jgi:hypothetical protein